MKNFVQPGDVITAIAPAAIKSGDPVLIGALFGVAATDALIAAEVELAVAGVFDLPKAAGAIIPGDPLYFDAAAKKLTKVGAANALVGVAVLAAADAALTVRVRLGSVALVAA